MPYSRKRTKAPKDDIERERAAMAELHARDLSNECTPVHEPIVQGDDRYAECPEQDNETPEGPEDPAPVPSGTADTDDYDNPARHRGEPWVAPDKFGDTVGEQPPENGPDMEDADPGFIAETGDDDGR